MDEFEVSTILAALRFYQAALVAGEEIPDSIRAIATNDGALVPLDVDQIDQLCEHING